jgi:hypothetical protein
MHANNLNKIFLLEEIEPVKGNKNSVSGYMKAIPLFSIIKTRKNSSK